MKDLRNYEDVLSAALRLPLLALHLHADSFRDALRISQF